MTEHHKELDVELVRCLVCFLQLHLFLGLNVFILFGVVSQMVLRCCFCLEVRSCFGFWFMLRPLLVSVCLGSWMVSGLLSSVLEGLAKARHGSLSCCIRVLE
ncbi:hypothetical protein U1Q18_013715 [Sarracenia purpurea var. burkii]